MSKPVNIRFFAELNDLLPAEKRNTAFDPDIHKARSVKDLIESIGVPHTEVDLIIVDGKSVDFSVLIKGGEQILVYPANNTPAISPLIHNRPQNQAHPRFVLDVHLGKLAVYLRMLSFDTLYRNDYEDATLADISVEENRILLSCDKKLLMRKKISCAYLVRSRNPKQQIVEVLSHFQLPDQSAAPARCLHCNGLIQAVEKSEIESRLLPLTRKHYDTFYQCNRCHQIYWEGSHHENIQQLIDEIRTSIK